MGWSAQATFFLLAAVVQAAIGLAILIRRPRVEWALVLAVIFLGNAALNVNSLLTELSVGPWRQSFATYRTFYVFDRLTTLLILYLAVAYPHRPRWARRPWVLPTLFFTALALLWFPFILRTGPDWNASLYDPVRRALTFELASIGFLVLLVRWAYLLPRTPSPSVLGHFQLLFAAFAMRGIHVELLFFGGGTVVPVLADIPGDPRQLVRAIRGFASLIAVAVAAGLLLHARGRVPSENRRAIDIVLAFMVLGFLEFLIEGGRHLFALERGFEKYVTGALLHLDVSVARPILVVYAMVRFDFLGSWNRNRRGLLAFTAIIATIGFASALHPGLSEAAHDERVGWALTIPVAVGLATITTAILNANIGTPRPDAPRRYLALLDDLYRNGQPSEAKLATLERQRRRLGLDANEAEALRAAVANRWTGDGSWLPGQRVAGRYVLQRLLGAGGWGEAYLADDAIDGRPVVLKRTKELSPTERKALLAEAYALTKLSHPSLVPLVRTEVIAGEPVLVLEHMTGGSLASRLAEGRLSRDDVREVANGLLSALEAVHDTGIVHGDIKPGNLLYDPEDHVRLADFGQARHVITDTPRLGDPTPTARAHTTGTVRYLAPEQARGQPSTSASDIYAAGIVLLECLTGRHPVPAGKPEYEQKRVVAEEDVELPASLGPWRGLLARMLERDPTRRSDAARARRLVPRAG